jgi:hypothetical protein
VTGREVREPGEAPAVVSVVDWACRPKGFHDQSPSCMSFGPRRPPKLIGARITSAGCLRGSVQGNGESRRSKVRVAAPRDFGLPPCSNTATECNLLPMPSREASNLPRPGVS